MPPTRMHLSEVRTVGGFFLRVRNTDIKASRVEDRNDEASDRIIAKR